MQKQEIFNFRELVVDSILHRRLINEGFRIFSKRRLCDTISKEQGERLSDREFQYLTRAHLDFLIAKENFPKFAVEFDGVQHHTDPKTIERDALKNKLCKMADLPLLRITTQEICKADKITLLDYMLLRYIAWDKEYEGIMDEIREYAENLSQDIDPDQLATDFDPNFHFNIRHPFPDIQIVQERLWKRYRIAVEYSPENRKNNAQYICNIEPAEIHLGHSQFDRHIVKVKVWKNEDIKKKAIFSTKRHASIRSWLPLMSRIPDWSQIGPLLKKGDHGAIALFKKRMEAVWMPDLPGIDALDIAENFAKYLGFRAIEIWAENKVGLNHLNK